MRPCWVIYVIYIAACAQYAACERKPPTALRCWTCSRRIFEDASHHYCIQGNFGRDSSTERLQKLCDSGEFCMVTYKVSADGSKNVNRRCGNINLNRCYTDPIKNSTTCNKSCSRNLCNTQRVSAMEDMMINTTEQVTTVKSTTTVRPHTTAASVTQNVRESTTDETTAEEPTEETTAFNSAPSQPGTQSLAKTEVSTTKNEETTSSGCNRSSTEWRMILLFAQVIGYKIAN